MCTSALKHKLPKLPPRLLMNKRKPRAQRRPVLPASPREQSASVYLDTARAQWQAGRFDVARQLCLAVLKGQPTYPDAQYLLSQIAYREGDQLRAQGFARSACSEGLTVLEHGIWYADLLLGCGAFGEAVAVYQSCSEFGSLPADAVGRFGVALHESGDIDGAIVQYERAVDLDPGCARHQYNLGAAYKRVHDWKRAIAAYRCAVKLDPEAVELRFKLGVLLVENGYLAEAAGCFEAAVERRPGFARGYDFLSYVHAKLGNGDQALRAARRCSALEPNSVPVLNTLGNALLCAGDAVEADQVAAEVLALDPGNRKALAYRAIASFSNGDRDTARQLMDYSRFLRIQKLKLPSGFDSIQSFNKALIQHVYTHPTLDLNCNSLSCHHGYTSDELLVEPKGPVALLEAAILAAGDAYRAELAIDPEHPYIANLPTAWKLSAWTTILQSQGYQHGHIHPTGWLSGVYYVALPSATAGDRESHAGWIEFGRAPDYFACAEQYELHQIEPEEGLLVLFPSYFFHNTVPFVSDEARITIAFDFRVGEFLN